MPLSIPASARSLFATVVLKDADEYASVRAISEKERTIALRMVRAHRTMRSATPSCEPRTAPEIGIDCLCRITRQAPPASGLVLIGRIIKRSFDPDRR